VKRIAISSPKRFFGALVLVRLDIREHHADRQLCVVEDGHDGGAVDPSASACARAKG
jgi:hypothetical protein